MKISFSTNISGIRFFTANTAHLCENEMRVFLTDLSAYWVFLHRRTPNDSLNAKTPNRKEI